MAVHRLPATPDTTVIGVIQRDRPPVLTVDAGDTVDVQTAHNFGDAVTPELTVEDIARLRAALPPGAGPHTLTGPIAVRGARAGQALRVDIGRMVPGAHGFNLILPAAEGAGLLPDACPEGQVRHFHHDLEGQTTSFDDGITLALRPFLGIMAVAPGDDDVHTSIPPGHFGGNMDLPVLTEGTTLHLPVFVDGGLFSAGDAHALQGNGEVCLTAIETTMEHALLTFDIVDLELVRPYAETSQAWITIASHTDLLEASKIATADMIALLGREMGLSSGDAYSLCSLVGDLSITQVVSGVRGVHMTVPKSIFASQGSAAERARPVPAQASSPK